MPARGLWGRAGVALVIVAYTVGVWALFLPLGLVDTAHIPSQLATVCGCHDEGQQVWLLAVFHARLAAGHSPLFTTAVNYPTGVNLMDTASFPLLATIAAPLTGWLGPVATYGLLIRLGLLLSATACFLVLRRVRVHLAGAAVGGAIYAFSPFLVGEAQAHLFITFAPLPPVILLVLYRQLRGDAEHPELRHARASHHRFRSGLLLGLLLAVQGLISVEVLAITVVVIAVVLALLAIGRAVRRLPIREPAARLGLLVAGAAVIVIPVLAYPAWYLLRGPRHFSGPPSKAGSFALSPLPTLFPNSDAIVAGRLARRLTESQGFTDGFGYIGIPLVLVVIWLLVRHYRHPVVIPATLLGAVSWVLSLGPRIRIGHGPSEIRIPLPFAVLDHLPLVQSIVPNRLALFVYLSLAILVAVALDRLLDELMERNALGRTISLAGTAAVLASVALIMPATAVPVAGVAGAQYFRAKPGRTAVPSGAVVIAFPYPEYGYIQAQLWQAESGVRFSLVGGYAERPLTAVDLASNRYLGPDDRVGYGTKAPATLQPASIARLFIRPWSLGPGAERRAERHLPGFVARYHVTSAMVLTTRPGAERVVKALTTVFGPPIRKVGAVLIWPSLRHSR